MKKVEEEFKWREKKDENKRISRLKRRKKIQLITFCL